MNKLEPTHPRRRRRPSHRLPPARRSSDRLRPGSRRHRRPGSGIRRAGRAPARRPSSGLVTGFFVTVLVIIGVALLHGMWIAIQSAGEPLPAVSSRRFAPARAADDAPAARAPRDVTIAARGGGWSRALDPDDARAFADGVVARFAAGDRDALAGVVDLRAMLDRALRRAEGPPSMKDAFVRGVEEAMADRAARLDGRLDGFAVVGTDGTPTLTRMGTRDGRPTALLRFVDESEHAANYVELVLATDADGEVVIVDALSYQNGELISDSIARTFEFAVSTAPSRRADPGAVQGTERYAQASSLARAGRHEHALRLLDALPAAMRRERFVMITRLAIARQVSVEGYLAAFDALEQAYPGDRALDLAGLLAAEVRGDGARMLRSAERLRRAVGDDGWLDAREASAHLLAGDFDAARTAADRAIASEPQLRSAWEVGLRARLAADERGGAVALLVRMSRRFDLDGWIVDFEADDANADFIASSAYRAWKKTL